MVFIDEFSRLYSEANINGQTLCRNVRPLNFNEEHVH